MNKNSFLSLGFITLFGFGIAGFLVNYFFSDQVWYFPFLNRTNFFLQLAIGIPFGFISAFAGWKIVNIKKLKDGFKDYSNLLGNLDLSIHEIIFISFCAGFGEELFFRGALQQFWGIWITAIFFVAIHGYLNPKNWKLSVYGIFMTIVIAALGYGYEFFGIWTSISAHFAIDVFLLYKMVNDEEEESTEESQEDSSSFLD